MDDRQPLLDAQQAILLPLPATWSGLFEASQPASDIPSSSQLCLGLLDDSDREVYAQIYAYIKEQYESRAYTDWMQIWCAIVQNLSVSGFVVSSWLTLRHTAFI
ncbi:unnamed protein product [Tilletia laevis]|uniref:Uncharacterized protein n=1 Tax=Tilletia laevis TaxID=157183 RepID=A0A9N8QHP0_9BASI|nr:hypothetical protein CF335_g5122 [Tilletia laevis]CAD6946654.1 unnamed protein product [Tilletia laevis]CAD6980287.1 unnamed protein product [Tilletia controversa]